MRADKVQTYLNRPKKDLNEPLTLEEVFTEFPGLRSQWHYKPHDISHLVRLGAIIGRRLDTGTGYKGKLYVERNSVLEYIHFRNRQLQMQMYNVDRGEKRGIA